VPGTGCLTRYSPELIAKVLEIKGPAYLCDEISRDENPRYVEAELMSNLLAYLPKAAYSEASILDFGCGAGASSLVMARHFPTARIRGIDLAEPAVALARARQRFHGLTNVEFVVSRDRATGIGDLTGEFDFIVMNAVFEHLLPDERGTVLHALWRRLRPGGVLFVNGTPYRYWLRETRTTGLYLINYLPDSLAALAARLSRRVAASASWQQMLRAGIRGGSEAELLGLLPAEGGARVEVLEPSRMGLRDRIDLRCHVLRKHGARDPDRSRSVWLARWVKTLTGRIVLPTLSIAVRKPVHH
jgi:predicted O-methyltransferase YrrM